MLGSFDKGTESAKTLTVAAGADEMVMRTVCSGSEGELAALTISVARDVFVALAIRNASSTSSGRSGRAARRSRFDAGDLP